MLSMLLTPQSIPPLPPAGGAPIYAPKAVRFRLGGLACFAPDGTRLSPLQLAEPAWQDLQDFGRQQQAAAPAGPGGEGGAGQQQHAGGGQQLDWVWESAVYPMVSHDALQVGMGLGMGLFTTDCRWPLPFPA